MASLPYTTYAGYGVYAQQEIRYSQAVRIGDRILCSGQGGWLPNPTPDEPFTAESVRISTDIGEEIAQAFANVELTLREAGGQGWSQVFRITTLSVDAPGQLGLIVAEMKRWMPGHMPLWTAVGVKELAFKEMRFEIEVEALDPR